MEKSGLPKKMKVLAISIGIVYFWFGILKFFPGVSPAEHLASETIFYLTFGLIPANVSIILLAVWEIIIGFLFIFGPLNRVVILLTLVHMVFTFSPLILFPELSFNSYPFSLTLVGQYIIKNIIIVSALLVIYPEKSELKAGKE
jgi:uncharacterized membrane protein YkgB